MVKMDQYHRIGGLLTNSIIFGESVFPAGFNQKTSKEDQNIK
jgi:hypothetical protein